MANIKMFTQPDCQMKLQQIEGFMWRDRQGTFHKPENMTTQHVFFTLRMIWNHSAPLGMRIKPYKQYNFGSFYTKDYMITAVYALAEELSTRTDLQPYFIKCLNIICGHINPQRRIIDDWVHNCSYKKDW
jgi:hypothetical protein